LGINLGFSVFRIFVWIFKNIPSPKTNYPAFNSLHAGHLFVCVCVVFMVVIVVFCCLNGKCV
jgi:succinate dehydrogenase/fumarate reductase cytochrome b subunit